MKLYYSPTSPYVRKVSVTVLELGMEEKVERVPKNAWAADTDVRKFNPLGKIPMLILDSGGVIFDSRVICSYIDASSGKGGTICPQGDKRALESCLWEAAADGILDACVFRTLERQRPQQQQSESWIERYETTIKTTLEWFQERTTELSTHGISIGTLTLAIALDYIDLRCKDLAWRTGFPALERWYRGLSERESMKATLPPSS